MQDHQSGQLSCCDQALHQAALPRTLAPCSMTQQPGMRALLLLLLVAGASAARLDGLRHFLTGSRPRFELHDSKIISAHRTCAHHNHTSELFGGATHNAARGAGRGLLRPP
jgi:hypothetical protein